MINGLPDKLCQLRAKYGYSQKQVANKIGASASIVSAYETGERTPSAYVLLKLAIVYNCSTDYLLGKETSAPTIVLNTDGLTPSQIQAIQNLIDSIKKS